MGGAGGLFKPAASGAKGSKVSVCCGADRRLDCNGVHSVTCSL